MPICPQCRLDFIPNYSKQIYCSGSCWAKTRVGEKNPHWQNGQVLRKGYRYVLCPGHPAAIKNNYVLEHRLIMERKIGRFLMKEEVVHHLNHDRLDNRPENLILLKDSVHKSNHIKINNPIKDPKVRKKISEIKMGQTYYRNISRGSNGRFEKV